MNPIFSPAGEGWPGFPARAYARLDQTEPLDPREADEAVFCFDALDADWPGFATDGAFELGRPQDTRARLAAFWRGMFGPPASRPLSNLFDPMPIYRIEVTSRPGDRYWKKLVGLGEEEWVTLTLAPGGDVPVDVYGGILAGAVEAWLASITSTPPPDSAALDEAFDVDLWPDAADDDIDQAIANRGTIETLVAFDVGQGAAAGLLDGSENVRLFFDLGAGAYGNVKTRPKPLRFCWRKNPPIVLSHWDTDHWAGEITDPHAASRTWVAPRQRKLGPTHHAFAARILAAGGTLLIWGAAAGTTRTHTLATGQTLTLSRCTGRSRNGSGIAGLVEACRGEAWLLTGDAGYHELALAMPTQLSTVLVPHHGANMGAASVAPRRPPGYTRLVYSFGPGNTHGRTRIMHPTAQAVTHHANQGWSHGAWSLATPAQTIAGGDVLATAENPAGALGGRHLDSAASGWMAAPAVPYGTLPCGKVPCPAGRTSANGCTGDVKQA